MNIGHRAGSNRLPLRNKFVRRIAYMRHFVVRVKSRFSLSRLGSDDLASMIRLHELSTRLTAKADLMSTLQEVLDAAIELLHADFGNTQLYNEDARKLEIVAQRGFQKEFLDYFRYVDADDGSICGQALKRQSRVIIEDV